MVRVRQPLLESPPVSFPANRLGRYATQSDIAAHEAASDPHPTYTTAAEATALQRSLQSYAYFVD